MSHSRAPAHKWLFKAPTLGRTFLPFRPPLPGSPSQAPLPRSEPALCLPGRPPPHPLPVHPSPP